MIEQIFDEDFNSLPEKAKKELLYQGRIKVELLVLYLYFFCLKPYEDNAKNVPWLRHITSINSDSVSGNFVEMTAEKINELIQPTST